MRGGADSNRSWQPKQNQAARKAVDKGLVADGADLAGGEKAGDFAIPRDLVDQADVMIRCAKKA
jgi:hypothetical protein